MTTQNKNLLETLENIQVNEKEQAFVNKAIHQLKHEQLSEMLLY